MSADSPELSDRVSVKVRGNLINPRRLGMKTENGKFARWIWLSKQNEKSPNAPNKQPHLKLLGSSPLSGRNQGPCQDLETRGMLLLEAVGGHTIFHRNSLPRAPECLSSESHFQIPADLQFPRKGLKASR